METIKYNFHTHSHLDDGQGQLEEYVTTAIEKGFAAIGFSGHSPLPLHNEWSMPGKDFPDYVAQIKKLKEQYKEQISVYLGLEIDYIPGASEDFAGWINNTPLDYCIGSVHLVRPFRESEKTWFIDGPREGYLAGIRELFGGDVRQAVTAFYRQSIEMVETQPLQVIGHLDKVKMNNRDELFSQQETWYRDLVDELLQAIRNKGVIVELNTRGLYTGKSNEYFPSDWILQRCLQQEIPVMVNADAHQPHQVDQLFDQGVAHLKQIGFTRMRTPFFEAAI